MDGATLGGVDRSGKENIIIYVEYPKFGKWNEISVYLRLSLLSWGQVCSVRTASLRRTGHVGLQPLTWKERIKQNKGPFPFPSVRPLNSWFNVRLTIISRGGVFFSFTNTPKSPKSYKKEMRGGTFR